MKKQENKKKEEKKVRSPAYPLERIVYCVVRYVDVVLCSTLFAAVLGKGKEVASLTYFSLTKNVNIHGPEQFVSSESTENI